MRGHLRPRDTSRPFATAAQGSDLLQPPPGWSTKPQRSLQAPGHTAPVRTYLVNEPRLGPPTGREGSTGHSGEPQCAPEHGSVHPVNRRGPTDAPTAPGRVSPPSSPPESLRSSPEAQSACAIVPPAPPCPSHRSRTLPWAAQSAMGNAERHRPRRAPYASSSSRTFSGPGSPLAVPEPAATKVAESC